MDGLHHLTFALIVSSLRLCRALGSPQSEDSIDACKDKNESAACSFRLPTVDDGTKLEESVGEEEQGICDFKGVTLFCRTVPSGKVIEACEGLKERQNCNISTADLMEHLHIEAFTSLATWAGTRGSVFASFELDGVWTPPEFFFKGMTQGQTKSKLFKLRKWPTKVGFTIESNDAWGYWKIVVNGEAIVEDPKGQYGSDKYCSINEGHPVDYTCDPDFLDTQYWIEGPPASQYFDIVDYDRAHTQDTQGEISVLLSVFTSKIDDASTNGCVSVRFLVQDSWTDLAQFFCRARQGEIKRKEFTLAAWPTKLWMALASTDAWGYWKVTVDDLEVLEDPAGMRGSHEWDAMGSADAGTSYWMEAPSRTQFFRLGTRRSTSNALWGVDATYGKCAQSWNNVLFCDEGFYFDKLPAKVHTRSIKEKETWWIFMRMIVLNVDYGKLADDNDLHQAIISTFRLVTAASFSQRGVGFSPDVVHVKLSEGSVQVDVSVECPAEVQEKGFDPTEAKHYLKGYQKDLTTQISNLGGMPAVVTGDVSCVLVYLFDASEQERLRYVNEVSRQAQKTMRPVDDQPDDDEEETLGTGPDSRWMELTYPKVKEYQDGGDSEEKRQEEQFLQVEGSGASLVLGLVGACVGLLLCCVTGLSFYVCILRKRITEVRRDAEANPTYVGRPMTVASDAPSGAVVSGLPVQEKSDPKADLKTDCIEATVVAAQAPPTHDTL